VNRGCDVDDFYVRFRHVEHAEDEQTGDRSVMVYYDKRGKAAAVEITDITSL
jgi:uncharacterized protein YuzE